MLLRQSRLREQRLLFAWSPISQRRKASLPSAPLKRSKEERKTGRARLRAIQRYVPDTPQFKALNRKRIIYSAIGLGGMVIAIILSLIMPTVQIVPIGIMIVSWVFFFISVRIDSKQLRPLRQEAYERAERKAAKQAKKH